MAYYNINMDTKNPLLSLVTNDEVDLQKVTEILASFIGINKENGLIFLKPEFTSLLAQEKLQILLLAVKAKCLLGFSKEENISPKDLIDLSSLQPGTVKVSLKRLKDAHLIEGAEGLYEFPNYRIEELWKKFLVNKK